MLTDGTGRGDLAAAVAGEGEVGVVSTLAGRRGARRADTGPPPTSARPLGAAALADAPATADVRAAPAGVRDRAVDRAVGAAAAAARSASARSWFRPYRRLLIAVDLAAAAAAATTALVARTGLTWTSVSASTLVAALLLPLAWVAVLAMTRAYEERFLGIGTDEWERVFRSFLYLTALVSFGSYATDSEVARGFVGMALPGALLLGLGGRRLARRRLHSARGIGRAMCGTVAVGDAAAVADFSDVVGRDHRAGLMVVAACLPPHDRDAESRARLSDAGIPVLGPPNAVREAVLRSGAGMVAVLSGVTPGELRGIGRRLEDTDADLVVSPGLTDVAGTRLHVRPVGDLPLLHVERPEFTGFRRLLKGAFDRVVAGLALVVLAPLLGAIALAVACTSRGPVFFRQERIGLHGRPFTMVKFRSMYADAPERRADLLARNECADGPLFKVRSDPRVTPVGRALRRYSLDELPQLINVVTGAMSLVGPRPPLPEEVARYRGDVSRRLLVKPGITGLWQVSGRSDLSWEESVRLDLRYVENWSLALDLSLLCRTVVAVVRANGAY